MLVSHAAASVCEPVNNGNKSNRQQVQHKHNKGLLPVTLPKLQGTELVISNANLAFACLPMTHHAPGLSALSALTHKLRT